MTSKRVNAIGLLREWGREQIAKNKPVGSVYMGLHGALHNVLQEFLTEHELEGVRYWFHPESYSYFLTAPGEQLPYSPDSELCIELARHEYLSRQGLHYDYLDNEL